MSQTVWAQPFPGGVADTELTQALSRGGSGQLVALSLADGSVLWRSAERLLPLLLGHGLALGLTLAPARVVALDLTDAGTERWRSDALPWPDWAAQGDAPASTIAVHAGWLDDHIVLQWHLQPLYQGGMAREPSRTKAAATHGACLLDATGGALSAAPAGFDSRSQEPAPHEACDDPSVLAQQVLGGVRYRLQQESPEAPGHTLGTALVAHDLRSGRDLWRCVLDDAPRKAPRALRP